jgi:hypothetical protein
MSFFVAKIERNVEKDVIKRNIRTVEKRCISKN